MFKNKFKIFNQFCNGVICIDKNGTIKYNNNSAKTFIQKELKNKRFDKTLMTILEIKNKIIYHDYLLTKENYDDYIIIFIQDMKDVTVKLHDIRHDIKNLVNPLVLLESETTNVKKVILDIIDALDDIQVKMLI